MKSFLINFKAGFVFQTNLFFSETKTKVIPNCVYLLKKGSSRFQDKVNKEQKEGEKQRNFNPRNEKKYCRYRYSDPAISHQTRIELEFKS